MTQEYDAQQGYLIRGAARRMFVDQGCAYLIAGDPPWLGQACSLAGYINPIPVGSPDQGFAPCYPHVSTYSKPGRAKPFAPTGLAIDACRPAPTLPLRQTQGKLAQGRACMVRILRMFKDLSSFIVGLPPLFSCPRSAYVHFLFRGIEELTRPCSGA